MKSNRLKVLMLSDDFEPIYGGVSSIVKNSSISLSKFADVTIGTVMPPKKLHSKINDPCCYNVIRGKGKYNKITTNMDANLFDKKFKDLIEQEKYDIIHCHFPLKLYKYALLLRKKYNIPVVITAHSIFYSDFKDVLKFESLTNLAIKIAIKRYNKSNKTFCTTKFAQDFLSKYGLKNVTLLNNAVDMSDFEPIDENFLNSIKIKCSITNDDFVLTTVGRLVKMKNLVTSIYAFFNLHKKFKNTKYLIVGSGSQYKELQQLINNLHLNDCCFLVGAITNKQQLGAIYYLTNAICFLSKGDSCGLIQYEGAYFKKPTIAIENTAIADCLIDFYNGVVLKASNDSLCVSKKIDQTVINSFVDKVGKLITDRELCNKLGENAFKTVYTAFDDNYAHKLLNIYESIIEQYKKQ